jgi:transcriptional regulator with XRE-family HTH domain
MELRTKRIQAGISGYTLCLKSGVRRGRLSDIERGYITPTPEELARLNKGLEELTQAKLLIEERAAELGWPVAEVAR